VSDFTVAELKTLKLKQVSLPPSLYVSFLLSSHHQEFQRLTTRTTLFDHYFTIPTFDEYLALVKSNYDSNGGKTIGIFPELKV
jgi:glycerophosphoryl diester phosphodiesterase